MIDTHFKGNEASEGSAVYVLSPVSHWFENCVWLDNKGLPKDSYYGFKQGVTSRGAALYSGLLSINVTFYKCKLINNTGDDSGTISVRPTVFKGTLNVIDSEVDDRMSLLNGKTTFAFKYIPGTKITFLRSRIIGSAEFSTGSIADINASSFTAPSWYKGDILTVNEGGVLAIKEARPVNVDVQVSHYHMMGWS